MHLLPAFVTAFFSAATAWLVTFFTRKMTVAASTIASFIFILAAFVVCIKQIVLYVIALAVIPSWILTGIGMFLPLNFTVVLSSILSAQSCRWAFDKAIEKVKFLNNAT